VFVSKYHRSVFTDTMLTFCEQLMLHVCTGVPTELREFNGETDEAHLLVHYPLSLALSALVYRLKGVSSHRLRQQYIPPTCGNICEASPSGHRPTSPPPAAAPD
jgi:putative transposase